MSESKQALIVVDVQNDFCPGGTLAVPHGDEVVEPLNKLIDEFLERGAPVYKSRDWHPPVTKHFAVYGGTWPVPVSYTHLRAHETPEHLVCRLLLEKKK